MLGNQVVARQGGHYPQNDLLCNGDRIVSEAGRLSWGKEVKGGPKDDQITNCDDRSSGERSNGWRSIGEITGGAPWQIGASREAPLSSLSRA